MRPALPRIALAAAAALALLSGPGVTGCSPIERQTGARQQVGMELAAPAGGTMLQVDKTRDLPNIVGRADLWGRKVNEGYILVRYLGLQGELPVFGVEEVTATSNETTLSRGFGFGSSSGNVVAFGGASNSAAVGQHSSSSVYIPPSPPQVDVSPVSGTRVVYNPADGPFIVAQYRLRVLRATSAQVSYRVEQ